MAILILSYKNKCMYIIHSFIQQLQLSIWKKMKFNNSLANIPKIQRSYDRNLFCRVVLPFIILIVQKQANCKIENVFPFQPSGLKLYEPLAIGNHFVADSHDIQSNLYAIDHVNLLTKDVTRLNSSVSQFDKYTSYRNNTKNINFFLVLRNGHLTYQTANFSTSTVIQGSGVLDMVFGDEPTTFYYSKLTNSDSQIIQVKNVNIKTIIHTINSQQVPNIIYENQMLVFMSQRPSNNKNTLHLMNSTTFNVINTINFGEGSNEWNIEMNDRYILLMIDPITRIYDFSGNLVKNFGNCCQWADLAGQYMISIANNGLINQYSIDQGTVVSYLANPYQNYGLTRFHFFDGDNLLIYSEEPNQTIYLSKITSTYFCDGGCQSCRSGYFVNDLQECQIQEENSNSTNTNSSSNTTNNTSDINDTQNENFGRLLASNTMFFTILRTNLKSIVPMYIFLQDIWPYQFHNQIQYTNFMESTMQEAQYFSTIKNKPSFLQILDAKKRYAKFTSKSNQLYQPYFYSDQQGLGIQDFKPYFAENFKQFIFWSIPITVFFYFLIKFIYKRIRKVQNESDIFNSLKKALYNRSKTWILLLMFFDSALLKLAYEGFNQISVPFFFNFENKANFILGIVFLFGAIIYSTCFLMMVKKFHPNSSLIILTAGKPVKKGFLLETLILTSNKCLKAFVHSNIIPSHEAKLLVLIGINLFQLGVVTRLRNSFVTFFFFILTFLYDLIFMCLDISLYLKFKQKDFQFSNISHHEQVNFFIIVLIVISVIKSLVLLKEDIVEVFKGRCPCLKSNEIQDEETLKQKVGYEGKSEQYEEKKNNCKEDIIKVAQNEQMTDAIKDKNLQKLEYNIKVHEINQMKQKESNIFQQNFQQISEQQKETNQTQKKEQTNKKILSKSQKKNKNVLFSLTEEQQKELQFFNGNYYKDFKSSQNLPNADLISWKVINSPSKQKNGIRGVLKTLSKNNNVKREKKCPEQLIKALNEKCDL